MANSTVRTLRGQVLENRKGCLRDLRCYLRVDTGDTDIFVVYHYGASQTRGCPNESATRQGLEIAQGDRVEVSGAVIDPETISTCESDVHYIKKLEAETR